MKRGRKKGFKLSMETRKRIAEVRTKHGMSKTNIYYSWNGMISRCLNGNDIGYKNYGGRGITVCREWLEFTNFYKDMGERPEGKTLDRIKNDLGYCKSNCKWSTMKEQENNRRNNHILTYQGKTQTVSQWAEELGINRETLFSRIRRGLNTEKVLTLEKLS